MLRRKIIAGLLLVATITGGALSVAAQQGNSPLGQGNGAVTAALEAATIETGLDSADILAQLAGGATLAEVVESSGGEVQVVIDAAVAAMTERVNSAVEDGLLTDTRADLMLSHLQAAVTEAVNGEWTPRWLGGLGRGSGPGNGQGRGRQGGADNERGQGFGGRFGDGLRYGRGVPYLGGLLNDLDLDQATFVDALRAGASVSEAIVAAGGEPEAALDAALTRIEARHDAAIENGWLTQAQADALLTAAEARLNAILGLTDEAI